ncbi:DUF2142 domain-containing protein [Candidatus Enterococcus ikei]|uniref:DUF2142 domain-containing protein n=1 Tax=Candidatus Enterococcus ikei TaxID=2815326 RepID=A0ABS3GV19_9ENTE|nr:DUF2142 domain-containing protein [Enterococcus sp. DIV0869a]MBO0439087.1 DUF2142 domain-containing protein [Enterococcus sp. DIV0869a]
MKKQFEKPEKIFLLLASVFISLSIFLMPIARVPDEASHARMAWGILYEKTDKSFQWQKIDSTKGEIDTEEYYQLFTKKLDFSNEKVKLSLPPKRIMQLPQLLGMSLGKIVYPSVGIMITLGRIFNAIFYILMMYFIIKHLKYGKMALMFISLLPIMIQQSSSLSYDVMNFVAVTGFFAILSNLSVEKLLTKKYMILLLLATVGLYITKINNLFLVALLLTLSLRLPEKFAKTNVWIENCERLTKKYKYILIVFVLGLLMTFSVFYLKDKGGITNFAQVMLNTILDNNLNPHLNTYLTTGMFGYLGIFDFQIPMWLIFIDIAVLTILLMKNEPYKLNKSFGVLSGGMLPFQAIVIIGGMYFAWTPLVLGDDALISQGAQGRYFTPFLIYLAPLFISCKEKMTVVFNEKSITKLAVITIIMNFVMMIYLILLTYWFPLQEAEWLINLRQLIG